MPKKNARKSSKTRASWERGYQSHGYWQGKNRLGKVQLGERGTWDGIYRWQASNRAGQAKTLAEAKRAVEETVLSLAMQLSLFGDPDNA